LAEDEAEEVGGVRSTFRWRRWRGPEREGEMRKRGELIERDVELFESNAKPRRRSNAEPSAYSVSPALRLFSSTLVKGEADIVWSALTRRSMPSMSTQVREAQDEMSEFRPYLPGEFL